MITIYINLEKSGAASIENLLKSISYSASDREAYEIMTGDIPVVAIARYSDRIYFSDNPKAERKIEITLPGDVLVLGNSWDKYINYDLEHNVPVDVFEVIKRLALFETRPGTLTEEIRVTYCNTEA